jgi:hypothetical protein
VCEGGWERKGGNHNTVAVVTIYELEREFLLCEVKAGAEEIVCRSS